MHRINPAGPQPTTDFVVAAPRAADTVTRSLVKAFDLSQELPHDMLILIERLEVVPAR